ncbi:hypothetical protein FP828_00905 [bacterium]|nr:hypothetical protein [bacterium]
MQNKTHLQERNSEFWKATGFIIWGFIVAINFLPGQIGLISNLSQALDFSSKISGTVAPNILIVLFRHILTFASGFAIIAAGYGFGKFLFQKLLKNFKPGNVFLYHFGFGQGALIFFLLFFGYLGLLYKSVIYCIILAGLLLCFSSKNEINFSGSKVGKFSFFEKTLFFILIFSAAVNLMGSLIPETYFDSLVYHLSIPRWWLLHHKIAIAPYVNQTYYPLNMEVLFTAAISFSNSSGAKMINWFFALATCVLIYETAFSLTRKRGISIFSAVLYYTTPLLMMQTWRTGNEIGQGLWEILMIFNMLRYFKSEKKIYLILAGAAMGLSLGAKHPAMMSLLSVTGAFWLWNIFKIKLPLKAILKKYTLFLAFTVLTAGPWYMKTFIATGNPLFPQFAGKISDFRGELRENFGNFTTDQPAITHPKNIATALWDVTMGKHQGAFPGAVYLILAILLLIKKPLNNETKFLLFYLIPYTFLWITVGGAYLRRFLPGLTSTAVLLGTYLAAIDNSDNGLKSFVKTFMALLMLFNVYFSFVMVVGGHGALNFLMAKEDEYTYIRRPRMAHPKYGGEVFRYINTELAASAVILFISETRPFYAERDFIWTTAVMGKNPIVEWSNSSESAQQLYEKLKEHKVSHLFFSLAEYHRLKGYNMFYWSENGREVFKTFWERYIALEYQSDYSYLYRITEEKHILPKNLILEDTAIR